MNGYLAAAVAALIWAAYPVATRAAVTGAFAPQDLVALRFGISALLFVPYLAMQWRHIRRVDWFRGVPLTLFHGAGMAGLVAALTHSAGQSECNARIGLVCLRNGMHTSRLMGRARRRSAPSPIGRRSARQRWMRGYGASIGRNPSPPPSWALG